MSAPPLDLAAFLPGFLAEVDEHLGSATRNLLAVEANLSRGLPSPRLVRELFRSMHTIKGLAAMVGVEPVVDIAHALEARLRDADQRAGRLEPSALEILVEGITALEQRVRALARKEPVPVASPRLLERLGGAGGAPVDGPPAAQAMDLPPEVADKLSASDRALLAEAGDGRRAVRVDFVPSPERAAAGLTITTVREGLGGLGEIVKVVPLPRPPGPDAPVGLVFAILLLTGASDAELTAIVAPGQAHAGGPAVLPVEPAPPLADEPAELLAVEETPGSLGVVRVAVARLDEALEKLSALVVTRFRLERAVARMAARGEDVRELGAIVAENARQLRDLRTAIMEARMVTAAELLERTPLLVRRVSRETGKDVRLQVDAGTAELDKGVAERVFPALVHLLRNAVDHGIEPPAERVAAGKPATGTIHVTCFERNSNQLEISIEDDGRGIDGAALAARARRPPPSDAAALLALLTLPGLSSRDETTTTSGRGMGMEIVKRVVVDELGGELTVSTTRGAGTRFVLRLPLTITIVDAFSFRCADQVFVVPVAGVEEIIEVDPTRVVHTPSGQGRAPLRMIERRGTAMPLFALDRVFGLGPREALIPKAIVVGREGAAFGFEVDQMLGQQEVVVRPLEDALVKSTGVVGSTDLGDGRPTLVLDLLSLSAKLSRRRTDVRL